MYTHLILCIKTLDNFYENSSKLDKNFLQTAFHYVPVNLFSYCSRRDSWLFPPRGEGSVETREGVQVAQEIILQSKPTNSSLP